MYDPTKHRTLKQILAYKVKPQVWLVASLLGIDEPLGFDANMYYYLN